MTADDFAHVVILEPLIVLADAKAQLRITDTAHDAEIGRTIVEAQNVILDYLKKGADPTWTAATVPYPVLAAIKKMVTHLYEDRGDDEDSKSIEIWDEIERLLARFRDPALA